MSQCETCGWVDGHPPWCAANRSLAARVAKLEARTNAAWGPIEPFELPRVAPTFEELVAKVGPLPSGQPASAGGAPKRCPHGVPSHLGCWNCTSHAVKVGDVVMDEPPAEQPTGCPGCACCNDDACPTRHADCHHAEQPSRQETGGDCGVPGCRACTAMRDRAKAKAAEQDCRKCADRRQHVADLEMRLAQAERERDERGRQVEQMAAHVAKMRVERDEWKELAHKEKRNATDATRDLENGLVQSEVRVDEATARERERCLAWAQADVDNGKIAEAISNGAPAPTRMVGPIRRAWCIREVHDFSTKETE